MNWKTWVKGIAVIACCCCVVQSVQALPFLETFEPNPAYMARTNGVLDGQHGWSSVPTTNAQVQSLVYFGGTNSASVVASNEVVQLVTNVLVTNAWIDVTAIPSANETSVQHTPPPNASAAFFVGLNGSVYAYSNTTWLIYTNVVSTGEWCRLTAFVDYPNARWELHVADGTSNRLATVLATNLAFNSTATNTSLHRFGITQKDVSDLTYMDNFAITTNLPLHIDRDMDGLSDAWEIAVFTNLSNSDGTGDVDGDGVIDLREFIAGTDPHDTNSYFRIFDLNPAGETNMVVWMFGGDLNITSELSIAGDSMGRSYTMLSTENDFRQAFSNTLVTGESLSGSNSIVDVDAVSLYTSRFYRAVVSYGGQSYTNTTPWAMYSQLRPIDSYSLVTVPIDYGDTNDFNLGGTLGQHIARGMTAGTGSGDSDVLYHYDENGTYNTYYLIEFGTETNWYDFTIAPTGAFVDVTVATGTVFWARRINAGPDSTRTVLSGKTISGSPEFSFTNGWNGVGYVVPTPLVHTNNGMATTTDQLGLASAGAQGGDNADFGTANADEIWIWKNNRWEHFYWLIDINNAAWDDRWWDYDTGDFADFGLYPGEGYFYIHRGGGLTWTPSP